MIIGIVGVGVVGEANKFGFEKLGHKVVIHDIKYNTKISDIASSEIVFICVPTPAKSDGSCDTSIIEGVIKDICDINYKGIVVIKSTARPGTTKYLSEKYNIDIAFVPEFLRERCAISDFVEHHHLLAVGTNNKTTFSKIVDVHGSYPKNVCHLTPTQAEMVKYFHNCFNALRVVLANEIYEITKALGEEYTPVKNALICSSRVPDMYFDVNDNCRGYAGMCLTKDVKGLAALVKELGLDINLFKVMDEENAKFKPTVFTGMRLS